MRLIYDKKAKLSATTIALIKEAYNELAGRRVKGIYPARYRTHRIAVDLFCVNVKTNVYRAEIGKRLRGSSAWEDEQVVFIEIVPDGSHKEQPLTNFVMLGAFYWKVIKNVDGYYLKYVGTKKRDTDIAHRMQTSAVTMLKEQVDLRKLQMEVLGYTDDRGLFPYCKSREDLTYFVNSIKANIQPVRSNRGRPKKVVEEMPYDLRLPISGIDPEIKPVF